MRASAITLFLATGLLAVSCGGGQGDGPTSPPAPLQNGEYQRPYSSYQPPPATGAPSDYQKPPSIYQGPGSTPGSTPPEGSMAPCDLFCGQAQGAECEGDPDSEGDAAGMPYDECMVQCEDAFADADCADQANEAARCVLDKRELSCEELGRLENFRPEDVPDDLADACAAELAPYLVCLENDMPDGGGGSCTFGGNCTGCRDECERCRCENAGDDGPCTTCRN